MKLLLALILAFAGLACDKTIHEVRAYPDGRPAPLIAPLQPVAQAS